MIVANLLRRHRIEVLRLSPAELAVRLRTSASYVRNVESGLVEPPKWYAAGQIAVERLIVAAKEAE